MHNFSQGIDYQKDHFCGLFLFIAQGFYGWDGGSPLCREPDCCQDNCCQYGCRYCIGDEEAEGGLVGEVDREVTPVLS